MFERIFVISLDFTTDKRDNFLQQIQRSTLLSGIEVWPAVHGDTCNPPDNWHAGNGAWGCYRSHINILEYCLNNRVSSYLVFEDDAQFRPDFDDNLELFMDHVPDDWQQIYLGGQLQHERWHPPVRINPHVLKPYNVNRTHCFGVSRSGMLPIYQHLCRLPFAPKEHIDHHLGRWHEDMTNKVYVPNKWLVGQHGFPSNVSGNTEPPTFYDDPDSLALSHWLYERPLVILFRGSRQLVQKCRSMLHIGNQIDANGFDVTLSLAAKMKDPKPDISNWFQWIRAEIVRGNTNQLPCVFHDQLDKDTLLSSGIPEVHEIEAKTVDDVRTLYNQLTQIKIKPCKI